MSYHDIRPLSRSGIGLGSLLRVLLPLPHPPRSIQPRRPAIGPDNERVITPRWPTAVLLGRAAFPRGDYYSFYSPARTRPLFRAGPDYDPFDSATLLPSTHPRAARCALHTKTALFPSAPSHSLLSPLRPFIPLRFTFSAFLWGSSIYELSSIDVYELTERY